MAQAKQTQSTGRVSAKTRWSYGLGCIGRDATYTLVTSYILTYLTLAVGLTDWQLGAVGAIMVGARIWDAVNDPMMGTIIDNTNTRWGKFKPYIISGALLNSFFTVLLFWGYPAGEQLLVVIFGITYILWGMTYTMNDISYWSMMPSLTTDPVQREKVSSTARIGANIGAFAATALVPMFTSIGRLMETYRLIAVCIAVLFVACQFLVVFGVTQQKSAVTKAKKSATTLKGMVRIISKNDQLLALMVAILLFNIGYYTTVGFGLQFFYFDYGNYGGIEYTLFALTLGVTQIVTLALYPRFAKFFSRRQLFGIACGMMILGYILFFMAGYLLPLNMVVLCAIGLILFAGQAVIQLLNYVMLADTVEYGQWKLGTRNDSIVFSLNPFVTKLASAIQAGIFTITLTLTGLNAYSNQISELENNPALDKETINALGNEIVATIPGSATLGLRVAMLAIPAVLVLGCYLVFRKFWRIDEKMYKQILTDLESRSEADA